MNLSELSHSLLNHSEAIFNTAKTTYTITATIDSCLTNDQTMKFNRRPNAIQTIRIQDSNSTHFRRN